MRDKISKAGLVLTLIAGAVLFAVVMSQHNEIHRWLFWRYAGYWAMSIAWALCCGAFGYAALTKARVRLAMLERIMFGFALGIFAFGLGIFLLGLLHLLNVVTFFLLPLAFAAFGVQALRRDWSVLQNCARRALSHRIGLGTLVLVGLGVLGIGLLYIQILTPDAFSFDTRWYHLPMAQRHAFSGAIERWDEGFWMGAYPQLATYLYTWVFLAPIPILFDRLEACAHLEFVVFLLTLAQIPVLVRRLVPRARVGASWTLLLAFPGIYLYDSNLHAGADHIAALFAIPIAITFWRCWHHFRPVNVLLFSIFASAAALTKYTALIIVAPPGLALLARALFLCARLRNAQVAFGLLLLVAAPLLLTTPHWLKNWVWHGDPIFPILNKVLTLRPWSADAAIQLEILEGVARPGALTAQGLLKAAESTLTFSFEANDWYDLRRNVPMFGSLFTLTLPCLLFVRGARRLLWLYALSMAAVFAWYVLSHYERFLQVVLPWMTAATAACLIRIWHQGHWIRFACIPMILLQVVWGGDVAFIRTHNLIGDSPLRRAALFIPSGFEKTPNRLSPYEPLPTLGRATPKDAVVLAHDVMMILGIDRNWVTDLHQSRISYARLLEPAAIDRELKSLGVTHLIWANSSYSRESIASDLAFMNYAVNYTKHNLVHGGYTVATLPQKPPVKIGGDRVALYVCRGPYSKGWYKLSQLTLPIVRPRRAPAKLGKLEAMSEAAPKADYIAVDTACSSEKPPADFVRATARGTLQLYIRDQRRAPKKEP